MPQERAHFRVMKRVIGCLTKAEIQHKKGK